MGTKGLLSKSILEDIADSIRNKTGSEELIAPVNMSQAIDDIPSGSEVESKDIDFYDFDGTRVYSYTKEEFLELEAMPSLTSKNPELTFDGWNWTLEDAKDWITDYDILDVGAFYYYNGESTKIKFELFENNLNPYLPIFVFNSNPEGSYVTVDWGDNSEHTIVNKSSQPTIINHKYAQAGIYTISITPNSDETRYNQDSMIQSYPSSGVQILLDYDFVTYKIGSNQNIYSEYIYEIKFGKNNTTSSCASLSSLKKLYCNNTVAVDYALTLGNLPNLEELVVHKRKISSSTYYDEHGYYSLNNKKLSYVTIYNDHNNATENILAYSSIKNICTKLKFNPIGCSNLESIILTTKNIEYTNIDLTDCTSLKRIAVKNNEDIEYLTANFTNCYNLKFIKNGNNNTIMVNKDDSEEYDYNNYYFKNCHNLEYLARFSTAQFYVNDFKDCKKLRSLEFNLQYGIEYDDNDEELSLFGNCISLEEVSFLYNNGGEPSFNIPDYCFTDCYNLININIDPDMYLETIGHYSFKNCTSLRTINLAEPLRSIGDESFRLCLSLETIDLPSSLQYIGNSAFADCDALISIICRADTPPELSDDAFTSNDNLVIYVPAASVDTYKEAEYWSDYADYIQAIPAE